MARDDLKNVDDLYRIVIEEIPDNILIIAPDIYGGPTRQAVDDNASGLINLVEANLPNDKPTDMELLTSYNRTRWGKIEQASVTAEQNNRFRNGPIITVNTTITRNDQ